MFACLSPGSVQAEIQIEVANPNVSIVRNVVEVIDNLGNFSLNRNLTKVRSEPGKKFIFLKQFCNAVINPRFILFCCPTSCAELNLFATLQWRARPSDKRGEGGSHPDPP